MKQKVLQADRAQMNSKRWCLLLSCGHNVWVTSARMPKRATADCKRCEEQR